MHPDAVSGLPVRLSARAIAAPSRSAAEVVRLARGLRHPVVLTGHWAAGEIVLAADPIHLECSDGASGANQAATQWDLFELVTRQPELTAPAEEGALGGGWFGWFGYAPGSYALGFFPNVLCYRGGQWWDEALLGVIDDDLLEARRRSLVELLASPPPNPRPYAVSPVTASRDKGAHVAAVERCIQLIRAGEIYQANICLTLEASFASREPEVGVAPPAADLAADVLTALQPPYGAYVALGDTQVASASPELFLRRAGRHVTTRPIKGTRPRTTLASGDEAARLAGSTKDRAENVMIVDLMRNDLSRVAAVGSVRVAQLLDVVAAPGVWHLVSTVEATLDPDASDADLLRAAFPPGSVTGVPKKRALEAIAELEDRPRGVYTGAIGYVSPAAGLELSVAIRTLEITADRLALGVGGGITALSTPQEEWWECFDKARPLLAAVGAALAPEPSKQAARSAPDPLAAGGVCDTSLLRGGQALERADHLARLERSVYELYQRPLPVAAGAALLEAQPAAEAWERQRIDVAPDGTVRVTRAPVAAPVPVSDQEGIRAIVLSAATGFGGHKWADRRRQAALEAAYPECAVILGGRAALLESTRANVIAVLGERLVTAPLDGGILPGATRTIVLDLARDLGVDVELKAPNPQQAQALCVVSSIAGMRWIRRCDGAGWSRSWSEPGPLLAELSRRLVERWTAAVDHHATVGE